MRHFLEYCVARDEFLLLIRRLRRSCRFITSIEPIGAFIWRFTVWATRAIALQHVAPLFPSRRLAPTVICRVQIDPIIIRHWNCLPKRFQTLVSRDQFGKVPVVHVWPGYIRLGLQHARCQFLQRHWVKYPLSVFFGDQNHTANTRIPHFNFKDWILTKLTYKLLILRQ